jgi:hypothetical protein
MKTKAKYMETSEIIIIGVIGLAITLTIFYFIIKGAVKSANAELLHCLRVLVKIKGQEIQQAYKDAMKDVGLEDLEKKRQYLSVDEYMKRQVKIMEQYGYPG